MSIWTSKAVAVAAIFALAGCDTGFNLGGVTRQAPERISLPDGTVIAGADGWCVDTSTSSAQGSTAVVVLGSCAAIAGNVLAARPDIPGLVTVAIEGEPGVVPTAEELEAFFISPAGRAALARNGDAASLQIIETVRNGSLLMINAEDQNALPGANNNYWRALFDLNGRFLSVSLFGPLSRPIPREDGLATLIAQVNELRSANDL